MRKWLKLMWLKFKMEVVYRKRLKKMKERDPFIY